MKKSRFIIIVALLALFVGQYTLSMAANPPEPTYGTAVVDGDPGEWDLANDFFADMWEAGDPEKPNAVVTAKLYIRYDCASQTVYFLVLTEPEYVLFTGDGYAGLNWVKVYDLSNDPLIDGNGSPFAFISNGQDLVGWEASVPLAADSYTEFEVHAQIENNTLDGATSSTGKNEYRIPLSLICPVSIDIEKYTNGVDADNPTGPEIPAGSLVTWTYMVSNTSQYELFDVSVVDDNGTPGDTADDFSPTCNWSGVEGYLAPFGSVECTASGTAGEGQYGNIAKVVGNTCPPEGVDECEEVMDEDPSHYIGTLDYGDLPEGFGMTTLAQNGARHSLSELNMTIGLDKDLEGDGIPDGAALGDDLNNIADEEGVYPPTGSNWSDGQGELTVVVDVDIPAQGYVGCLTGWLDFHDGASGGPDNSFDNAGEYIIQNAAVMTGENQLTFTLPAGVADDASFFGRFRLVPLVGDVEEGLCTQTALGYMGSAEGGEVEDQVFVFGPTAVSLAGFSAESSSINIQMIVLLAAIGILSLVAVTVASFAVRRIKA